MDKIENIEPPLAHMIPEGAGHIVLPIVSFIALFAIDWRLALAALAVMLSMSMVGSLAKLEVFSENMRQVKATVESLEAFLEMPALPRDVAGSHRGQGVGGLVRREGGINHVQNCQTHHRLVRRI